MKFTELQEKYENNFTCDNDLILLEKQDLGDGIFNISLWSNGRDSFSFDYKQDREDEVIDLLNRLLIMFDFSFYLEGDFEDLYLFVTGKQI